MYEGGTQEDKRVSGWKWRLAQRSRIPQANPWGCASNRATVRRVTSGIPRKVAESTLPGKASKENSGYPYPKPTQVDEESIQRRSDERSFRN